MRNVAIKLLVVSMLASTPFVVSAQQADDQARGAQQTADREDHSEWGWLGLLGLAGLVGLKRRDRDHLATRDRATAR
ncbi:MAG TPA: WGxxGxxG family protein [Steroidobacteraceae bacterium]|nr:WGxxGxxG family protein [Steroidobacteraceae bacterium]